MIQLSEEARKQIINFDHHMGVFLHRISDSDTADYTGDLFDLADADIVSGSLDYRASSSGSKGFKLGCADSMSCNLELIRDGDNPAAELDLTGKRFDLYLANTFYEDGEPVPVRFSNLLGNFARYDKTYAYTGYDKAALGCTMSYQLTGYYADPEHGEYIGWRHEGIFTLKKPYIRVCGYTPLYMGDDQLVAVNINCVSTDYSGGTVKKQIAIEYDEMEQCSGLYMGRFIVAECPIEEDSVRRKLTAYECKAYQYLDEEVTYEAYETVYMSDVLAEIINKSLLRSEYANLRARLIDPVYKVVDFDDRKEYKFDTPGGGKVTFTLGKSICTVDNTSFGQIRVYWINKDAYSPHIGVSYAINKIETDHFKYRSLLTAPEWNAAYMAGGDSSVYSLRGHVDEIFHSDPLLIIDDTTVSFEFWRLLGASYTGNVLANATEDMDFDFQEHDFPLTDVSDVYCPVFPAIGADYDNPFTISDFDGSVSVEQGTISVLSRTCNYLVRYGYAWFETAEEVASGTYDFRASLTNLADYYDNLILQEMKDRCLCKDDGEFYTEEDEEGYLEICNVISAVLNELHDTYYPSHVSGDVKYFPLGIQARDDDNFSILTGKYHIITEIAVINAGRWGAGEKIVELTDDQDPQTGFIYMERDREISGITKRIYVEPLANLSFRADTAGKFTLREALSAYAELKGTLYDAKDKHLIGLKLALCPELDLYPATDLYPEISNGKVGDVVSIGDLLEINTGLFPTLTLYPSLTLYPLVESDVEGGDCNIIKRLDTDRFEQPLEFGGMRMETVDGWDSDVVYVSGKSIYEISNWITKNFQIPTSEKTAIYAEIWAVISDLSIPSLSTEIASIPWMELGDRLVLDYEKWPGQVLIYDRRIKGIQAAFDTIDQKL